MTLLDSLLDAIVRLDGEALVMHTGEKPYVVLSSVSISTFRGPLSWGQVELSSRSLTSDAVLAMLAQMLSPEQRQMLNEIGAIEHEIDAPGESGERFIVTAARGGDDVWVEVRRHKKAVEVTEVVAAVPDDGGAAVEAEAGAATPVGETGEEWAPVAELEAGGSGAAAPEDDSIAVAQAALAAREAALADAEAALAAKEQALIAEAAQVLAAKEAALAAESARVLAAREEALAAEAANVLAAKEAALSAEAAQVLAAKEEALEAEATRVLADRQEALAAEAAQALAVKEDALAVRIAAIAAGTETTLAEKQQALAAESARVLAAREEALAAEAANVLAAKEAALSAEAAQVLAAKEEALEVEATRVLADRQEALAAEAAQALAVKEDALAARIATIAAGTETTLAEKQQALAAESARVLAAREEALAAEAARVLAAKEAALVAREAALTVEAKAALAAKEEALVSEAAQILAAKEEALAAEAAQVLAAKEAALSAEAERVLAAKADEAARVLAAKEEALAAEAANVLAAKEEALAAEAANVLAAKAALEAASRALAEKQEALAAEAAQVLAAKEAALSAEAERVLVAKAAEAARVLAAKEEALAAEAANELAAKAAELDAALASAEASFDAHADAVLDAEVAAALAQREADEAAVVAAAVPQPVAPPALETMGVAPIAAAPRLEEVAVVRPIARPSLKLQPQPPGPSASTEASLVELLRAAAAHRASTVYALVDTRPMMRVEGQIALVGTQASIAAGDVERFIYEFAPREQVADPAPEWTCAVPGVGRVRCVTFHDQSGAGLIFHLTAPDVSTADEIGLSREVQALCGEADGLIVVAGTRFSGKSTLLSAFVDLINRTRYDHVITIESQIRVLHEKRLSFISQREVRGDGDAIAAAARAALREGPDVLVIEDLRAPEALVAALDAARAGRLVFGTISAQTAPDAVERLIGAFPADRRSQIRAALAGALRAVVAQALVRKKSGGRVAAREVLLSSPAVRKLLLDGATWQMPIAIESGRNLGMNTMVDALGALVRDGVVEIDEACAVASDRRALIAALARDGVDVSGVERRA